MPKIKGKACRTYSLTGFVVKYPFCDRKAQKCSQSLHLAWNSRQAYSFMAGAVKTSDRIEFFDRETLLRHFSEFILHDLVTHTPSTAAFDKQIADSLIESCFYRSQHNPLTTNTALSEYRQWLVWKTKITRTQADSPFHLCFQLHSPSSEQIDNWQIQFLVAGV